MSCFEYERAYDLCGKENFHPTYTAAAVWSVLLACRKVFTVTCYQPTLSSWHCKAPSQEFLLLNVADMLEGDANFV